jgi:hypothetical protein
MARANFSMTFKLELFKTPSHINKTSTSSVVRLNRVVRVGSATRLT